MMWLVWMKVFPDWMLAFGVYSCTFYKGTAVVVDTPGPFAVVKCYKFFW
jgi:hypothetical protein